MKKTNQCVDVKVFFVFDMELKLIFEKVLYYFYINFQE